MQAHALVEVSQYEKKKKTFVLLSVLEMCHVWANNRTVMLWWVK